MSTVRPTAAAGVMVFVFLAGRSTKCEDSLPDVRTLLAQSLKEAADIEDARRRSALLCRVAGVYAGVGDQDVSAELFGKALECADTLAEPRPANSARRLAVREQALGGHLDDAIETIRTITEPQSRSTAWTYIAVQRAASGDFDGAIQAVNKIPVDMLANSALGRVATSAAEAGKSKWALAIVSNLPSLKPHEAELKVAALRTIAVAQAQRRDYASADDTIREAIEITSGTGEPAVLKIYALTEFAKVRSKRLPQLLKEARNALDAVKTPSRRSAALWFIADAQAATGDIEGAKQTADAIKSEKHKALALHKIAVARAANGDIMGAYQTANSIPVTLYKGEALVELANAQARLGRLARARQAFADAHNVAQSAEDDEKRRGVDVHLFRSIAYGQTRMGDGANALIWTEELKSSLQRAYVLAEIAAALSDQPPYRREP